MRKQASRACEHLQWGFSGPRNGRFLSDWAKAGICMAFSIARSFCKGSEHIIAAYFELIVPETGSK